MQTEPDPNLQVTKVVVALWIPLRFRSRCPPEAILDFDSGSIDESEDILVDLSIVRQLGLRETVLDHRDSDDDYLPADLYLLGPEFSPGCDSAFFPEWPLQAPTEPVQVWINNDNRPYFEPHDDRVHMSFYDNYGNVHSYLWFRKTDYETFMKESRETVIELCKDLLALIGTHPPERLKGMRWAIDRVAASLET